MLMQVAMILLAVTPFSFDLHPAGVLVAVVMLARVGVGVGALSFALALASKGQSWMFWTIQQTLLFPALLTAGALLPMDSAPRWLEIVSSRNPMTYGVDAIWALFDGRFPLNLVLPGFAAASPTTAVGLAVGVHSMRSAD